VNTRIEEISIDKFDLSLSGMRIMNMTRILQVEKSMRLHGQLQPVVARVITTHFLTSRQSDVLAEAFWGQKVKMRGGIYSLTRSKYSGMISRSRKKSHMMKGCLPMAMIL
jgi:hypothetical protein